MQSTYALLLLTRWGYGSSSHGRRSHFHAPLFRLFGESRMKYTGAHENDFTSPLPGSSQLGTVLLCSGFVIAGVQVGPILSPSSLGNIVVTYYLV